MEKNRWVGQMDAEMASKTKVLRYGIDEGGVQRPLVAGWVNGIIKATGSGERVGPIVLRYYRDLDLFEVIDGQHRYEAWLKSGMSFFLGFDAMVANGKSAAAEFTGLNENQHKVSLTHRLLVDDRAFYVRLRALAKRHGITNKQAYGACFGAAHRNIKAYMNEQAWKAADVTCSEWRKDKRFANDQGFYSRPGTIQMVAGFAKISKKPACAVRALRGLDFSAKGPFMDIYGCSSKNQQLMKRVAQKFLARTGF